jgi:hypothetical protein
MPHVATWKLDVVFRTKSLLTYSTVFVVCSGAAIDKLKEPLVNIIFIRAREIGPL